MKNTVEMFHGLMAYSGRGSDAVALRQRADSALGAEICCADRMIGRVGLVVYGHCERVFAQDVWSRIRHGKRVIVDHYDNDDTRPYIGRIADRDVFTLWDDSGVGCTQSEVNLFCRDQAPEHRTRGNYAEAWVTVEGISAVWCRDDANDGEYWQAKSLALKLGVAFVELSKNTRIWEYTEE